jgi:hypothetical protein
MSKGGEWARLGAGAVLFKLRALDAILSELGEQLKRGQGVVRAYQIPEKIMSNAQIRNKQDSGSSCAGKVGGRTRKHLPKVVCSC